MGTKTVTISTLIDDYAQGIADEAGLDHTDYPKTANGLASLLTDVAYGISHIDNVHDRLTDAAAALNALERIAVADGQARTVLASVDSLLYEVHTDLV